MAVKLVVHDVLPDHYCMYHALLHAFCTQLKTGHEAHTDATSIMETYDSKSRGRQFCSLIVKKMQAALDDPEKPMTHLWDPSYSDGTLEEEIVAEVKRNAEKGFATGFARNQGESVASLLIEMRRKYMTYTHAS